MKSLLLILLLITTSCRETLVHNVSEQEANKLVAYLDRAGIQSAKEQDKATTWRVSVERKNAMAALRTLEGRRIVAKDKDKKKNSGGSLLQTPEESRFKYERALSDEIEVTLSTIPQVLEARVHLFLPAKDILGENNKSSTGSVLLLTSNGAAIDTPAIQKIVAGAAGIAENAVSVLVSTEHLPTHEDTSAPILIAPNASTFNTLNGTIFGGAISVLCLLIFLAVKQFRQLRIARLNRRYSALVTEHV